MKTVLLGLNEINFDYVKYYADKGHLPAFKALLSENKLITTKSEQEHSHQEPWIQWVTVYSGLNFSEHGVFRLGDIVNRKDVPQLFEDLEKAGYKVGAVSPFNADNRLSNPAFFIPDPWTQTSFTGSKLVKSVFEVIRKMVNENATSSTNLRQMVNLLVGVLVSVPIRRWPTYLKRILTHKKPGIKAVVLDSLLADIFIKELKKHKPDFANLFLNSGAHIQHHYLFNSKAYDGRFENPEWYCQSTQDPLLEVLSEYDNTISRLLNCGKINLIIATGLHQRPHETLTYYWRPKLHDSMLDALGVRSSKSVTPRMSRDFLIEFNNSTDAQEAEKILQSYKSHFDNKSIFATDNRGTSIFVELIYSLDITDGFKISSDLTNLTIDNFKEHVSFVAIKNGEHHGDGFLLSNQLVSDFETIQLTDVRSIIMDSVTQPIS